ncbi:hypothetical protein CRUP_032096 [Coryphaenoides rupestris]|nr:hypothetical protein CRUP_032096 [Coryphaenoides rupestris]
MATSEPTATGADQDPNTANVMPSSTTYDQAWMHGCTRKLGMKICGFLQKNNSLDDKTRLAADKNLQLSCDNSSERDARFRRAESDFSNLFARGWSRGGRRQHYPAPVVVRWTPTMRPLCALSHGTLYSLI